VSLQKKTIFEFRLQFLHFIANDANNFAGLSYEGICLLRCPYWLINWTL